MNANSDKDYIDARMEGVDARLDGRFAAIDAKFAAVDARFAAMEVKLEMLRADVVKWMVGIFIATIVIFISCTSLMVNIVIQRTAAAPPAAQMQAPAPIVIQIPPPAAPAAK